MNKEKMNEILMKVSKRMDLVALAVIGILMVVTGWLYLREQDYLLPTQAPPAVPQWKIKLPVSSVPPPPPGVPAEKPDEASIKHVTNLENSLFTSKSKISEDDAARRLIINNMFDLKSVEEQTKAEKELNEQYNLAQKAYDQKRVDDALAILNSILAKDAKNAHALELKKRIESDRKAPPAPAPAAAVTTPAVSAPPPAPNAPPAPEAAR